MYKTCKLIHVPISLIKAGIINYKKYMQDLPPFFKEYMEQKFNELHSKIDSVFETHNNEIVEIKNEIHEIKKDTRWLSQKVWMAIGALGIISIAGTVFASYFKVMNKQQIQEAIEPLKFQTQQAKTTAENTNLTLQKIINDYNIRVQ